MLIKTKSEIMKAMPMLVILVHFVDSQPHPSIKLNRYILNSYCIYLFYIHVMP